ncbi:hypothetical protein Pvag_0502 [Pantoea vagans C9-1]|nr:hypothetical protein Pvag_0502 [Pantoea vagans C9-1]
MQNVSLFFADRRIAGADAWQVAPKQSLLLHR